MLVWLASYPRSGNTLLRQILKACFDLSSCEGLEPVPANFRAPDGIRDEFYGAYFVEGDPDAFYRRARAGSGLTLIKSHQLPRDAEKAIYVVRDGRLALKSFVAFQDAYHPGAASFESLLVGDHPYGEWTGHFRAWCARERGETLVVRFEDLVTADAALLERIGTFLGLPAPRRPWTNPQTRLRTLDPVFFGPGAAAWTPDPFWTPDRLRAFHTLHGPLLAQLGYAGADKIAAEAYPDGSEGARLLPFVCALIAHRDRFPAAGGERDRGAAPSGRPPEPSPLAEMYVLRDRVLTELAERCANRAQGLNGQLAAARSRINELERHCLQIERRMWWRRLPGFGLLRRALRSGPSARGAA